MVLVLLVGCASMAPIPGGPVDHDPPTLVSVVPDTNSVNFHGDAVTFQFNEVVSDRSGPTGDLNGLFLVSPRVGDPKVHWHRDHIDVQPQDGKWRPNTAYAVTLLPGLRDLSGNATKKAYTVVFSTGPTMPAFGVHGRVFDWAAQRVAPGAVVEAIQRPDSVVYFGIADSSGQFHLGPFGPGTYSVIAYVDGNHSLIRDANEIWDSAQVNITDAQPYLELLAAARDTIGPSIVVATALDSTTIQLTFDKPLSPDAGLDTAQFTVIAGDSTRLTVATARTLAAYTADRAKAHADSVRQADSLAALRDTAAKSDSAAAARKAAPAATPATPEAAAAPADTMPKPSRPAPPTAVVLTLNPATALPPNTRIRVTATGMVNLLGDTATSTRVFATPKAAVKPDTTPVRPRPDTTGRRAPERGRLAPHREGGLR